MIPHNPEAAVGDRDPDADVLPRLSELVTSVPPQSFFLTAGAGSGKTWTLTRLLQRLTGSVIRRGPNEPPALPLNEAETRFSERLRRELRTIGVITYTNVARDEIEARLGPGAMARPQTIHSFCWDLIRGYDRDIREALMLRVEDELTSTSEDLVGAEAALLARAGKRAQQKVDKLTQQAGALRERRARLAEVERFHYSPDTGHGNGTDHLDHAQVLWLATILLRDRPTLRRVLAARHPVLLIDECQDTDESVLRALIDVEREEPSFTVGLIGDLRQRVYLTGAQRLDQMIPNQWERLALRSNRRSGSRVVTLINRVWGATVHGLAPGFDVPEQIAVEQGDRGIGTVRLFVGNGARPDKEAAEEGVAARMAAITDDPAWAPGPARDTLTLVLEHALAARRFGFANVHEALRLHKPYMDRLGDGTPSDLRVLDVLTRLVMVSPGGTAGPVAGEVMALLREHSPLLSGATLRDSGGEQVELLRIARSTMRDLAALWEGGRDPTIGEVVRLVQERRLLHMSDALRARVVSPAIDATSAPSEERTSKEAAIDALTACTWTEWTSLRRYFDDQGGAATHQGIKGAEHNRVLGVLDDAGMRGSLFAYDRFFEVADLSDRDRDNAAEGKETSIDRTRRLLYVVCSRARLSLAVVLWSQDPARARANAIRQGWFEPGEVEDVPA